MERWSDSVSQHWSISGNTSRSLITTMVLVLSPSLRSLTLSLRKEQMCWRSYIILKVVVKVGICDGVPFQRVNFLCIFSPKSTNISVLGGDAPNFEQLMAGRPKCFPLISNRWHSLRPTWVEKSQRLKNEANRCHTLKILSSTFGITYSNSKEMWCIINVLKGICGRPFFSFF